MPDRRPHRPRRHRLRRFIRVYEHQLARDPRRERLFLATLAFLLTFGFIRALTYSIRYNLGPFRNVSVGGTHVHHLVWGILLLLVVGYVALTEFGTRSPVSNLVTRLGAIGFGIGAALTLDEFALWLNLQDVYLGEARPPERRRRPYLWRHPPGRGIRQGVHPSPAARGAGNRYRSGAG
jgi:hypothetical protein